MSESRRRLQLVNGGPVMARSRIRPVAGRDVDLAAEARQGFLTGRKGHYDVNPVPDTISKISIWLSVIS